MYGLTAMLSAASNALNAESGAIAITSNNISNVNTAGYSRQLVNLSAVALTGNGSTQDNGVSLGSFTSVRDSVLSLAINQKTSDVGSLNAQSSLWAQITPSFSGTDSGLGASISDFFSDLSTLSSAPTDLAARQAALSSADQVASAFNQNARSLSDAESAADQSVVGDVAQINKLAGQIAGLDQQIAQLNKDQDGGTLVDQRDQLTQQLAGLAGLSIVRTDTTPSLSLQDGTPLVVGGTAFPLSTVTGPDGLTKIVDGQGQDIGAGLSGGSLGGVLTMRDHSIPSLQQTLDQLATQFGTAVNAAQAQGYALTGQPGTGMFSLTSGQAGEAASIRLSLKEPSGIALSSDGSRGSSGNLAALLSVQSTTLPGGATPTDTYAGLVQAIGTASAGAETQAIATNGSMSQLVAQQSSESGVSVDEETTNLLRYQQAYSAAAQVINTLNSLFSVVMNMGTVTG